MRCHIELSSSALLHNYRVLADHAPQSIFVPIIKGNAYGHGFLEIYNILREVKPTYIGVNYIFEAKKLRDAGYHGNILVVGAVSPSDIAMAATLQAEIFIGDHAMAAQWRASSTKPKIHLKFDTGMSRQGYLVEEAGSVFESFRSDKEFLVGVCSHFANVEDSMEQEYALVQLGRFKKVVATAEQMGFKLKAHMAASASTLLMPESHFDMVRVGISLYGLWPAHVTKLSYANSNKTLPTLKPVMKWITEVATIKPVKAGQSIGYGCTYQALTDMKIAVLPVGYHEGYPRLCGTQNSYVLIQGKRCPLVGRLCMNMSMADVTHLPNVKSGDRVTLVGDDGKESISLEKIGDWAQTIHYEIASRLPPDIPRVVKP
jgi:alanine racemase